MDFELTSYGTELYLVYRTLFDLSNYLFELYLIGRTDRIMPRGLSPERSIGWSVW